MVQFGSVRKVFGYEISAIMNADIYNIIEAPRRFL